MRLPIQISEMSPNSKSCGTEHENYSTVFRQRHLSVTGLLIYLIFIINSKNTTSGICSSAKSKTHFSFESIIWSALASFHLNEKHTIQATCSTHMSFTIYVQYIRYNIVGANGDWQRHLIQTVLWAFHSIIYFLLTRVNFVLEQSAHLFTCWS
jgi:hypothetical protein